jgi:hypothetical protein
MFKISIVAVLLLVGCDALFSGREVVYEGKKIKGICMVAPDKIMSVNEYDAIKAVNAEWVAITPYGFCRTTEPKFIYAKPNDSLSRKWQWWGERPDGAAECIKMAHQKGLKVMLKPHVWVMGKENVYTGDLDYKSDEGWSKFEENYREYVLDFARIADSTQVEMYCIATEFHTFIAQRPSFWKQLIADVKQIYKGKLTYAENWDKYQDVSFWNEMDFVGIDAYFPLSEKQNPSVEELKTGWKKHIKDLDKYARKQQKPILFTEIGYQSTDFSTQKPWESYSKYPDNETLQANAFRAFFESTWNEKWLAGAMVWKWFPMMEKGKKARDKYSPQNKPAEAVIRDLGFK